MAAFELESFIALCKRAAASTDAERTTRELVTEALADVGAVVAALGEPTHVGVRPLYRASDLTVIDFCWPPWMCFKPHNHNMWSIVGIVAGREDNVFWRRVEHTIEAAGARSLGCGDVTTLGRDIIHSVTNPISKPTRAIHVYGGDFFAPVEPRTEWDPETLTERPWDMDDTTRLFHEADRRARPR
jgi:predicted metal-dependent enzyme (double-stranded beta helix superfamily)